MMMIVPGDEDAGDHFHDDVHDPVVSVSETIVRYHCIRSIAHGVYCSPGKN